MDNEKLVAICRHELRLDEDHDVARLIKEVKMLQDDSSDTYARLTKEHRIKAREILSGYMLAWEYVEDLDGSRLWNGKMCRPDALFWPKDKKEILAGVEKMFNELQDYWIIDRQKRKSWPTPKDYKKADARGNPSPSVAQSTIKPPTEQTSRRAKEAKTEVALVPDHAAPIAQDTELDGQAPRQKEEPKRAVSKESYDADPSTQPGGPVDEESTEVSPSRKRALTPPYIPEKGPHQTWPDFGFKNVSEEGARALRHRIVKIDDSEVMPRRSKDSRVKANRRPKPTENYPSTMPAKNSEEVYIGNQDLKRTWKGHLPSSSFSLPTRRQAVCMEASDKRSPAWQDDPALGEASHSLGLSRDGLAIQATAVQKVSETLMTPLIRNRESAKGPERVHRVALRRYYEPKTVDMGS